MNASPKAHASGSKTVISVPMTPLAPAVSMKPVTRSNACDGSSALVWQPLMKTSGRLVRQFHLKPRMLSRVMPGPFLLPTRMYGVVPFNPPWQ